MATAASEATPASKPVLEKEFLIYRWSPEKPDAPTYQSYKVDINACVPRLAMRAAGVTCWMLGVCT